MEFKIDTKENFSIITPTYTTINATMAAELLIITTNLRQNGSKNYIVDFLNCTNIATEAIQQLIDLQEECYSRDESIVFTHLAPHIIATLKQNQDDLLLNIAPKLKEAIDIVAMEILERDLLQEDE